MNEDDTVTLTEKGEQAIAPLDRWPLHDLWERREELWGLIQDLSRDKGLLDQELKRRFLAAHPDYDETTGGTVDLVEGDTALKLSYTNTYEYSESGLLELARLVHDSPDVLSPEEYERLVNYETKVSGRVFNELHRRGGLLADLLDSGRTIKSARPEFERKARR